MAKMRTNTRVPTAELKRLVDDAIEACRMAREAIESQFPRLTAEARAQVAAPRKGFTKTVRKAVTASGEFATLWRAAGVDEEAVVEDIDNLDLLYPMQREVDLLKQVTDDAVLLSGDEAYRAMLLVYAVAKAVSGNRPEAEELVKMVGSLFDSVRGKSKTGGSEGDA